MGYWHSFWRLSCLLTLFRCVTWKSERNCQTCIKFGKLMRSWLKLYNGCLRFWTPSSLKGVLSNRPCPLVGLSLNISETVHWFFLIFCMMVEGNRGHHLSVVSYLGKILIRRLKGIKCQKFRFFDIFSETGHWKFLIFLHDGREQ